MPPRRRGVYPPAVVLLHGAGPRLEGLTENAALLARGLAGSQVLAFDAARPVAGLERAFRAAGSARFGYEPADLARATYDRAAADRVVSALEALEGVEAGRALVVVGHSLGAALAVEVVERWARKGCRIQEVLLLDRMFFELPPRSIFRKDRRMPRLTPRGARAIVHLQEVLVRERNLPLRERLFVSLPAGGRRPLDRAVAREAARFERRVAPDGYGHGSIAWWPDPWMQIARRSARGNGPAG